MHNFPRALQRRMYRQEYFLESVKKLDPAHVAETLSVVWRAWERSYLIYLLRPFCLIKYMLVRVGQKMS